MKIFSDTSFPVSFSVSSRRPRLWVLPAGRFYTLLNRREKARDVWAGKLAEEERQGKVECFIA